MSDRDFPLTLMTPDGTPEDAELVDIVLRHAPHEGLHDTAIEALQLIRIDAPTRPLPTIYEPGLCIVVQGRKRATLGAQVFQYDPWHALAVSMATPLLGQVVEASAARPYLCVRLALDTAALADLVMALPAPTRPDGSNAADGTDGADLVHLAPVPEAQRDALRRLLRLLDTPHDAAVLAPLALREIVYRTLTGTLGPRLRALTQSDGHLRRIARAIDLLRTRYADTLRTEELAQAAHMSVSALHEHFKQITTLTPLQFQKRLRLQHARQLMLGQGLDAASAGARVGYGSASQFNREYRRLFGAPPRRDVETTREKAGS